MPVATMTSKGQITIPKSIRTMFHLHAGDRLEFFVENEERIVVKPATVDISELEGILHNPKQHPVPIAEMDPIMSNHIAKTNL